MEPDDVLAAATGLVGDCPDPAFLVSMNGKILAWNSAACEFFGVPAWQASAHNCAAVVRGHSPDGDPICVANCPVLRQLRRGRAPRRAEMVALIGRAPASQRRFQVHHLPVTHPDAGPLGILHVMSPAEQVI